MAKVIRYQALDSKGKVIATGKRLSDVQGPGERIIIDYHQKRFSIQGFYPVERPMWNHTGLDKVGDILRHNLGIN